jgi:hypothetical protein
MQTDYEPAQTLSKPAKLAKAGFDAHASTSSVQKLLPGDDLRP